MARISNRLKKRTKRTQALRRRLSSATPNPGSVARWIILNRPPILNDMSDQEIVQLVREYWDQISALLPSRWSLGEHRQMARLANKFKRLNNDTLSEFTLSANQINSMRGVVNYAEQEQQETRWLIIAFLIGLGIGYWWGNRNK